MCGVRCACAWFFGGVPGTGLHRDTHTHTRLWRSGTLAAWTPVHPVVSGRGQIPPLTPVHPGHQCLTAQIPVHPGHQCQTSLTTRKQRQCQTSPTPVHPAVSDLPDPCTPSSVRPPRPLYTQQCTGVHIVPPRTLVHPGQQCQTSMTTRTDFLDPRTPSSVRLP